MIERGELLGGDGGIPRPGQDGDDELQSLRGGEQRVAEEHGLMLEFRAVACGETNLAEGVVETAVLGDLRELAIVIDIPARALLDVADDEAPADVGDPVGETDVILGDCAHGVNNCGWTNTRTARANVFIMFIFSYLLLF